MRSDPHIRPTSICSRTRVASEGLARVGWFGERQSLAAPGAFAGTADVRCAVAITGADLLRNVLENLTSGLTLGMRRSCSSITHATATNLSKHSRPTSTCQ